MTTLYAAPTDIMQAICTLQLERVEKARKDREEREVRNVGVFYCLMGGQKDERKENKVENKKIEYGYTEITLPKLEIEPYFIHSIGTNDPTSCVFSI